MTRDIPQSVVIQALWWYDSPTVQRHPRLTDGSARRNSWTGKRAKARKPRTRAAVSIGAACRYALYAWSGAWTEADLAEAIANVTRRVDAIRAHRTKRARKVRAAAMPTAAFNRALRANRDTAAAAEGPDVFARVARYLKRHPDPVGPPAWEAEIRERMAAEPVRRGHALFRDGQWWSSRDAYQQHLADQAERVAVPVTPARIIRPTAAPASRRIRGVSMGDLARLAADMNGRRI